MGTRIKDFVSSHSGMLILLMSLFLLQPIFEATHFGKLILNILYLLIVISGYLLVRERESKILHFTTILFGLSSLTFRWIDYLKIIDQNHSLAAAIPPASFITESLFFISVLISVFTYVLTVKEVKADTLSASVNAYLLIGFIFGLMYFFIGLNNPEAFKLPVESQSGKQLLSIYIYYSFVCLTTLGFGDGTPLTQISQSLTVFQAIVGQMYIALIVARLVGVYTAQQLYENRGK